MENDGERLDEVFESPPDETQDWYFDLPQGAWERQEEKNRNLRQTLLNKQLQQSDRKAEPKPASEKKRRWFGGGKDDEGAAEAEEKPRFSRLSDETREERRARLEALTDSSEQDDESWTTEPAGADEEPRPLLRRFRSDEEKSAFDDVPARDEPVSRWDAMFSSGLKEGSIVEGMRQWATGESADADENAIDEPAAQMDEGPADIDAEWTSLSKHADETSMLDVLRSRRREAAKGAEDDDRVEEPAAVSEWEPAEEEAEAESAAAFSWRHIDTDEAPGDANVAAAPWEMVREDDETESVAPAAIDESSVAEVDEEESAWEREVVEAVTAADSDEVSVGDAVSSEVEDDEAGALDEVDEEEPFEVTASNLVAWPTTPDVITEEAAVEVDDTHFDEALSASTELEAEDAEDEPGSKPGFFKRLFGRGGNDDVSKTDDDWAEEPAGEWVPAEPTPFRATAVVQPESQWEPEEDESSIEPARAEQLDSASADSPFRVMDESGWMPVTSEEKQKRPLDTSWMAPAGSTARDAAAWSAGDDSDVENDVEDEEDPWAPFEPADAENAQYIPGSAALADELDDAREPAALSGSTDDVEDDEAIVDETVTAETDGEESSAAFVAEAMATDGEESEGDDSSEVAGADWEFSADGDDDEDVVEEAAAVEELAAALPGAAPAASAIAGEPEAVPDDWSDATSFARAFEMATTDAEPAQNESGMTTEEAAEVEAANPVEAAAAWQPLALEAEDDEVDFGTALGMESTVPESVEPAGNPAAASDAGYSEDTFAFEGIAEPFDDEADAGIAAVMPDTMDWMPDESREPEDLTAPATSEWDPEPTAPVVRPLEFEVEDLDASEVVAELNAGPAPQASIEPAATDEDEEDEFDFGAALGSDEPGAGAFAAATAWQGDAQAESTEEVAPSLFSRDGEEDDAGPDEQVTEPAAGRSVSPWANFSVEAEDEDAGEWSPEPAATEERAATSWSWNFDPEAEEPADEPVSSAQDRWALLPDDENDEAEAAAEEKAPEPVMQARTEADEDAEAWEAIAAASGYDESEEFEPPTFGKIVRSPRDDDRGSWLADHFPEQEPTPDPVEQAFAEHDEDDMERDLVLRAFEAHAASEVDEEKEEPLEPGAFQELFGPEAQGIVDDIIDPQEVPSFAKMRLSPQRSALPGSAAFSDDDEWTEGDGEEDDDDFARELAEAPFLAGSIRSYQESEAKKTRTWVRELVETGLLALLVFLSVRASFQNFKVDGSSMSPTLADGQFLIVNKLVYSEVDVEKLGQVVPFMSAGDDPTRHVFHGPERGDIIVLRDPSNPEQDLIKRVIGLPGEKIEVLEGVIYINDQRLEEPYIDEPWGRTASGNYPAVLIPEDSYFVMGDNRDNSKDSRSSAIGFIPEDLIIGRAELSYLPLDAFGLIGNGDASLSEQDGRPTLTSDRRPVDLTAILTP